jgi:hypothetical protein
VVRVGRYNVEVEKAFDAEADEEFTQITLGNLVGDELEKIYPSMLGGMPVPGPHRHYWEIFDAIYRAASRQALGVDQAIRDILSELKKP